MSILDSKFIIDGVPEDLTLRELLDESCEAYPSPQTIVDESILEDLAEPDYETSRVEKYGNALNSKIHSGSKSFSLTHSEFCTLRDLSAAILETLFCEGIFSLQEIEIGLRWNWVIEKIGNAASLYNSVAAASDFLSGLSVKISEYAIEKHGKCSFEAFCTGVHSDRGFMDFISSAYDGFEQHYEAAYITREKICDETLVPEEESYGIYIPFDQSAPALAGSAFSSFISHVGSGAPLIGDSAYFSDCYQICREFIKDGIALSAAQVGSGGLYYAASRLTEGGCVLDLSTGSLESQNPSKNIVEILFSEIPGMLLQVSSYDRDYVDTELLLQEVAYYTVGKPTLSHKGLKILNGNGGAVAQILDMLLTTQTSEGED